MRRNRSSQWDQVSVRDITKHPSQACSQALGHRQPSLNVFWKLWVLGSGKLEPAPEAITAGEIA